MVDKVFWWRLVAAPFGLVDDDGRRRPAYRALQLFLELFGRATFLGRIKPPGHPVYLFRFRRPDGSEAVIGFHARNDELRLDLPFQCDRAIDALGRDVKAGVLTGRPVYYLDVS
jgi:hypothetical protein